MHSLTMASGFGQVAVGRSDEQDRQGLESIAALAACPVGDPSRRELRDLAIEAWLPLAGRLASRYAGRGESLDDLVQVATVGLIKAVDRYEVDRGEGFLGYAIPTILGEIRRHFRDRGWTIRVPRRLQEMRMAINEANTTLMHSLGHAPTVAEVAAHLQVSEEDVLEGLEGAAAYRATSLSTPTGAEGAPELGDMLGSDDHGYALAELHLALEPALARLTERERRIVAMRFYGNQTQTQIAVQLGVSQMQVSRLLTAALRKLRKHLGPDAG
jgi:RNA polymerase sigma-B factor